MTLILLFFILQLINVILSTIKYLLTIKGTKLRAAFINAFYYSIYAVIVIFTVKDFTDNILWNWIIKLGIVFITNFIGVLISFKIMDIFHKEKIWELIILFKYSEEIEKAVNELNDLNIPNYIACKNIDLNVLKVYSDSRKTSRIINKIIDKYSIKIIAHEENVFFGGN